MSGWWTVLAWVSAMPTGTRRVAMPSRDCSHGHSAICIQCGSHEYPAGSYAAALVDVALESLQLYQEKTGGRGQVEWKVPVSKWPFPGDVQYMYRRLGTVAFRKSYGRGWNIPKATVSAGPVDPKPVTGRGPSTAYTWPCGLCGIEIMRPSLMCSACKEREDALGDS